MLNKIIDTHVHVWTNDCEKYPKVRSTPTPAVTAETLLSQMEVAGVTHAVLIQPSYYGFDNTYLADCVQRYPRQFVGVGAVDVYSDDVYDQLDYWVKERGLQGIRLAPLADLSGQFLNQANVIKVWEKAGILNIPISIYLSPLHIPQLQPFLEACTETRVVLEHLGRPDVGEKDFVDVTHQLSALSKFPNLFIKVSALSYLSQEKHYPFADVFSLIYSVWEHFGSDRLMWGSDFPGVMDRCGYVPELDIVREHIPFFSSVDKDWLLAQTSEKLWNFN